MTDKLELKSCHEVVYTVDVADVESIFYCKPTDPDILTVLMKDGKRLYCDEVCPIDSMQEEPVSIDFEQELYKAFGQVKDFTLGMRIAKRFYDMGRKHQETVGEELEEAAMSYGRSVVQHACDELRKEYGGEYTPGEDNVLLVAKYFKAGAKWQKQRDQSTIELAEDHAMFAGMEKMKEQMMKDAVEATVTDIRTYKHENEVDFTIMLDKGIIPYETEEELKLIIIKED